MAELLVRVVDKTNPDDPMKCATFTKRGDVIVVQPDGWVWGKEELENPHWRILKIPGMSISEARAFLGEEMPTERPLLFVRQPMLQARQFKIDLDHPKLPKKLKDYIEDHTRSESHHHIDHSEININDFKVKKPKLENPFVIG